MRTLLKRYITDDIFLMYNCLTKNHLATISKWYIDGLCNRNTKSRKGVPNFSLFYFQDFGFPVWTESVWFRQTVTFWRTSPFLLPYCDLKKRIWTAIPASGRRIEHWQDGQNPAEFQAGKLCSTSTPGLSTEAQKPSSSCVVFFSQCAAEQQHLAQTEQHVWIGRFCAASGNTQGKRL